MIWDDSKIVAFDLETSGEITGVDDKGRPTSAYALQPWRLPQGKAWTTSASALRHDGHNLVPVISQLFPTKELLRGFLEQAITNSWTVLGWNITFDVGWLIGLGLEDLVMRVRWLDGMLLWRHRDIEPEYEFSTQKHKKKRYRLKPEAVEEFIPTFAGLDEDVDFHATDPESLAKLQKYNDRDNVRCWVISKMIWGDLSDAQRRAALIEAEAIPLVAQANFHGLSVDYLTVKHLGEKLGMDAAARLHELAPDGMTEKIVRSPLQLGKLLFDPPSEGGWGLPVLKENKSKVEGKAPTRSTDKEVLHELAFADPRVAKVKAYREALNARGKFCDSVIASLAYNETGKTHPIANIFSTYCVPGHVEVLTRTGWVALHSWTGGEIMQASEDGTLKFLPAERFVGPMTDEWVQIDHARLDCLFTPGHTMPYLSTTGSWRTAKAGELLAGTDRNLPVAGVAALSGSLTPEQMRVLVAVQADGCFRAGGAIALTFEKVRKQVRMRELLQACQIPYSEHVSVTQPGRVTIYIGVSDRPVWLSPERKVFGPWVLETSAAGLRAFVEELEHWDGSAHEDGGFRYVSAVEENALWATTAAALVGVRASAHLQNADGMFSAHFSEGPATVTIRPSRHCTQIRLPLQAYCATTQTGYWLARSGRHVFITGNTGRMTVSSKQGKGKNECPIGFALHQMKRGKEFREIITVDPGYDLVEFDAAGQEFRWMAVASGDSTMLQLCQPGEDAHSFMGAQIVGRDYTEMRRLVALEDKIAGQNRYLGKFANLSLQYRTSARKLRVKARIDYDIPMELPEAQRIWKTYQHAYPAVPVYWQQQIEIVKRLGYVETFAGDRVKVVGDWGGTWGWSMGSTAINTRIQGTGAGQKHLALMVLKPYLTQIGGRFLFDLHDGLYLAIPSAIRARAVVDIKRMLDNLPYQQAWGFTPPIPMPWDCKVGTSWGKMKAVEFD